MSERLNFQLSPEQVPEPPFGTKDWLEALRWVVMVADRDSSQFTWACRLIHVACDGISFSENQERVASDIIHQVVAAWTDNALDCQIVDHPPFTPEELRSMPAEGSA